MFFGKKHVIGLDIGSNSVKLAELNETKKGFRLKNVGEVLLQPQSIVNKVIVKPEPVIEAVGTLVDELRIKTKDVAISISGHSVIIKKVSVPVMTEKELREAIPWELEQYIPQSIEDVNYDFQILPGETPEGNMDVIIVAAKKDTTNEYLDIVSEVGLNPIVVDVDVFALENMYELNYSETEGVLALINVGASITNINILKDGVSIFTRDITTGGIQLTEWIQREFDVGYQEAEKMKYSMGKGETPPELESLSSEFNDLICGEINRTLEFFSSTLSKDRVQKIMLSGGSSKVPNIADVLTSKTESNVDIINPFKNIEYSSGDFDPDYIQDIAPKMSVATGLALRKMGDKEI